MLSCRWVTSVCYVPGGKVLSGGMDGRLWLWPAAGSSGTEIRSAHSAPVSKVASLTPPTEAAAGARSSRSRGSVTAGPQLAVSCSYDKTVKVWDVSDGLRVRSVADLLGHTGPVLEMDVLRGGGSLMTGERCCRQLIITSCRPHLAAVAAPQSSITSLANKQLS